MAARSVLWRAFHGFRAHHGSMFASAVSFWAVLSLLPTVLLAVSIAGHVIGSSDEAFRRTMSYLADVFTGDTRVLEAPMREAVEARGEVGGLGLGILLWSGTQWIVTLETALNALFGAPPRAFLVSRHEATVALHVGTEDGRELTLDARRGSRLLHCAPERCLRQRAVSVRGGGLASPLRTKTKPVTSTICRSELVERRAEPSPCL